MPGSPARGMEHQQLQQKWGEGPLQEEEDEQRRQKLQVSGSLEASMLPADGIAEEEEEEEEEEEDAGAADDGDSDYSEGEDGEEEGEGGRRRRRGGSSDEEEESDPDYSDEAAGGSGRPSARRRRARTPPGARRSVRIKHRVIDVGEWAGGQGRAGSRVAGRQDGRVVTSLAIQGEASATRRHTASPL